MFRAGQNNNNKENKMKELLKTLCYLIAVAVILTACYAPVMAQGVSAGLAYSQTSAPAITGWATFDKQISGRLYSYNGTQVFPIKQSAKAIPQLEFKAFTGVAVDTATFGRFKFFTQLAGGIDTNVTTTTGTGNLGGFIHCGLKGGWGLIGGIQGAYSPLNGKDAIFYYGVRYGVK
jgi:hypothetical protein